MTRRTLLVRREAEEDIAEAAQWYGTPSVDLRKRFLGAIQLTIEAVLENPFAYPVVTGNTRRAVARQFPYGEFYTVEEDAIIVLAVLHCRRNPEHWRKRT